MHCLRWVLNSILQFSERSAILNDVLEQACKRTERRTKRSVQESILGTLSRETGHFEAFKSLQDTVREAIRLSFPEENKKICIYTDTSDKFGSAVVTQTTPSHMQKTIKEQTHEPLALLGAALKGAENNRYF